MDNTKRLVTGVVSGVTFLLLTAAVYGGWTEVLDEQLRIWVLSQNSELSVEIWKQVTHLGSVSFLTTLTAFWCALLLVLGQRGASLWLLLTGLGATLLDVAGKDLVHRHRPEEAYPGTLPDSFSYPSGHAFFSVVLYFAIFDTLSRLFRNASWKVLIVPPVIMASIIGASRLFLGVHYLTDILAGYFLAVLWLSVMLEVQDGLIPRVHSRIDAWGPKR